jgi:hypothetical protein
MTTAKQVVARQIDRSGNTLLLALEPISDSEFFKQLSTGFSAAWTVGHLACVADLFSSWLNGRRLILNRSVHHVFNETDLTEPGAVSKAASVDRETFPKTTLLRMFCLAVTKALRALDEFGDSQWDAPAPAGVPVSLLTSGAVWEHLAVHVYWHLGELAGSMPRFDGTYTLNILPHHLYVAD